MRYYDVMDYGAVGNGVTDDTLAIQSAINDAVTNGGGRIYFPAKCFAVTGLVVKDSNISFHGEFAGGWLFGYENTSGTRLKYIGLAGGLVIDMGQRDNTLGVRFGCGIYDMQIDGNGLAHCGLFFRSLQNSNFERVYIQGCTGAGLYATCSDTEHVTWFYHNTFKQIYVSCQNSCMGIVLDGLMGKSNAHGRSSAYNNFFSCHVTHANGYAYSIMSGDDNCFYGCGSSRSEQGQGYAIYFHGSNKKTGLYKCALANHFFGFYGNGTIVSNNDTTALVADRWPARGNKVFNTGVDAVMNTWVVAGSVLYIENVGGQTANGYAKTAPETLA